MKGKWKLVDSVVVGNEREERYADPIVDTSYIYRIQEGEGSYHDCRRAEEERNCDDGLLPYPSIGR